MEPNCLPSGLKVRRKKGDNTHRSTELQMVGLFDKEN
jgi:hypothetical protein